MATLKRKRTSETQAGINVSPERPHTRTCRVYESVASAAPTSSSATMQRIERPPPEDFTYEPLPSPGHIRVLTILPPTMPGRSFEPICGTIESVELDKSADYYVMSYSWGMDLDGDATLNRSLQIDGKTKHITQNLYEGLLRFRDDVDLRPLRIWADAICINQSDNEERSQQVLRMHHVYQYCKRCLVWLGEGASPEDDADAHVVIQCYAQWFAGRPCAIAHRWTPPVGRSVTMCDWRIDDSSDGSHDDDNENSHWQTASLDVRDLTMVAPTKVWTLFAKRYFGRRWIFQELFYSWKRARVYWGPYNESLLVMLRTVGMLDLRFLTSDVMYREITIAWPRITRAVAAFQSLELSVRSPIRRGIANFLQSCQGMECTDPRDKLYSLLSMVPDFDMIPDYAISMRDLSITFAAKLIAEGDLMEAFCNANAQFVSASHALHMSHKSAGSDTITSTLPSWVPDLEKHWRSYSDDGNWTCSDLGASVDEKGTLTISPYVVGAIGASPTVEQNEFICVVAIDTFWCPVQQTGNASMPAATSTSGRISRVNDKLTFESNQSMTPKQACASAALRFPRWWAWEYDLQADDLCCLVTYVKDQSTSHVDGRAVEEPSGADSIFFIRPVDAASSTFRLIMADNMQSADRFELINVERPLKKREVHVV